ncbi:MAG: hypothetical protein WHS65_12640 [Melioribacteraceae bacterium]
MNKSILVVEPNTLLLKKLREVLSREGFDVITVTNIEMAVNICNKIKIEYILAKPEVLSINNISYKEEKDVNKNN